MADFIEVPNVVQMEARFSLNGQLCENVSYYRLTGGKFSSECELIGASFVDNVILNLLNSTAPELTWRELYFTDLSSQFASTYTYTTDLPISGSGILPAEANGVALVVCFRTGGRGRSRRGRNYMAGFVENLCVNSQWTPALVSNVTTSWTAHGTAVDATGNTQVVVSRQENGVPRAIGSAFDVTEWVVVTPHTRSQRRRNPGIGS